MGVSDVRRASVDVDEDEAALSTRRGTGVQLVEMAEELLSIVRDEVAVGQTNEWEVPAGRVSMDEVKVIQGRTSLSEGVQE